MKLGLQLGDLVLAAEDAGRRLGGIAHGTAGVNAQAGQNLAIAGDKIKRAAGGVPCRGGLGQIRHNAGPPQQPFDQRLHRVLTLNPVQRALAGQLGGGRGGFILHQGEGQRRQAGPSFSAGAEIGENPGGGFGILRQNELQMVPQRRFNRGNEFAGDANLVGERPEHGIGLTQGREGAGGEALVLGVELFEHIQAAALLRLLAHHGIQLLLGGGDIPLQLADPKLAFLEGSARGLHGESLGFDLHGKFGQARLQPVALLLQPDALGGQLFKADHVALFLKVQLVEFVAGAG